MTRVKCPRCGKETEASENPFRPFCSERCKLIDLGNWVSGTYRISDKEGTEDDSEAPISRKEPDKE
jgi:endogenous inhibitor of DNA gyrase (YacG/DUF329 family)